MSIVCLCKNIYIYITPMPRWFSDNMDVDPAQGTHLHHRERHDGCLGAG